MTATHMGVVGLGVMGRNLALNMADKGFKLVVFDPWDEAQQEFAGSLPQAFTGRLRFSKTAADLVADLPTPRTILIMVKAGDPVDAVIGSLVQHLEPGDTLIDGGNSHYLDTIRREAALTERGLFFIGLGISGGEEGARNGPSLMAGGAKSAFENCRPVLEAIAAKHRGDPCYALLGPDGAGHFVKMLHNGIEYGIMQVIAEAYVLLRDACGLDHSAMAEVFRSWNRTELSSYLVEITASILGTTDPETGHPLVEMILDRAGQKGTGRWSSEAALSLGVPAPSIAEAVFARALAAQKEERIAASKRLKGPEKKSDAPPVEAVRQALSASVVAIFAQSLAVIHAASQERDWNLDLGEIAAIWRNGCVIRSALLDKISAAYRGGEVQANLMCVPEFASLLEVAQQGWRDTVGAAVANGMAVPGMSSALAYYDGYRSERLSANMIQAQRDYFGAHTYERVDRLGTFHTKW